MRKVSKDLLEQKHYRGDSNENIVYLTSNDASNGTFDSEVFKNPINNIADLVNVMQNHKLNLSYKPSRSNSSTPFVVSENEILASLSPTIIESKRYLNSIGLSNEDINAMVLDNNAQEIDIIPFALGLASIQKKNRLAYNFKDVFFNSVNAQTAGEYGKCFVIAIGADLLWSLGDDASKWGKKAIMKLFPKVAARFMGPVGAAIAVVTFAVCMAEYVIAEGSPVFDVTIHDLLIVEKYNSSQVYYITKHELNYKSDSESLILKNSMYRLYNVNFGDISNPSFNVSSSNSALLGREIDPTTIREAFLPDGISPIRIINDELLVF